MKITFVCIALLVAASGWAQGVPNTFTAGQPARAAEVNENFASVDGRMDTALADGLALLGVVDGLFAEITVVESAFVEGEFFAESFCPADTIAISANCSCGGDGMTVNFGVLGACLAGDDGTGQQGAAAFCDVDFFFDPLLALPRAEVTATCLGATKVDGSVATAGKLSPQVESKKVNGLPTEYQRQLQTVQDRYAVRLKQLQD